MTDKAIQSRLALAQDAVFDAGNAVAKMYYNLSIDVVWKHDGSPVTKADHECEKILRRRISAVFPDDAIIGEEHEDEHGTSGFKWIIDPLDGTESFIRKVPIFGTLVGLELAGEVVAGLCYMPAQREYAWSSRGQGCWWAQDTTGAENVEALRERAIRAKVSPLDDLKEAMITTSGQGAFHRSKRVEAFTKLRAATRKDRGWGNCWGHLLVATGRVEVSIEPKIREWDVAPFASMVAEAGGRLTDFAGEPSIYSGHAICSNGVLHPAVLKAVSGKIS
ncbi:MAG: histidinol phosphate phosphatase [Planctomycetes bacterium]|nr:histidinol phosphate phosphatase [Planctomycetota bacterium]